jgi:hypothetical protein
METKTVTDDVKNEISKSLERLATLRDEVKVRLHLAELDAKQEWDEKLEPLISELQSKAGQLGESSREKVQELVSRVEGFYSKLRQKASAS